MSATSMRNGNRGVGNAARGRVRVVVAGGGVAALELALALRELDARLFDVELVAPEHHFWYRPLSVAEPFAQGHAHAFELAAVAQAAGATFIAGEVVAVDAKRRVAVTKSGPELSYDALVVASGARARPALAGALTFRGPADSAAFRELLDQLEHGSVTRVAFVVPGGVVWPLPLYELALMTAAHVRRLGLSDVRIALVTHESAPLEIFGETASEAVSNLLAERGIYVFSGRYAVGFADGELSAIPAGPIAADRVVALPRLAGAPIDGVPADSEGFVPVDEHGRVRGCEGIYAAGDVTTFPVKQGGIAAQQANAVAETIAAEAGLPVDPQPFRPVLRGLLLTGDRPAYLRAELAGRPGDKTIVDAEPLWWPPGKIVGRHLAPFLARLGGFEATPAPDEGALHVEAKLSALGSPARVGTPAANGHGRGGTLG